jgi:L-ascorbate metabolism protein UlaG (beta-lactamase superfamily)
MKKYYLKPNVKMEPLIWQWYAWPHLIAPQTAACNIVGRHLKIMESYILAPDLHIKASSNPKLIGGPYLNVEVEKAPKVEDLIKKTKSMCSSLIALDKSLKECNVMLQTEAIGGSLNHLYEKVPENLKGLVELVYDLNSHPSLRLIEPLIYKKYYSDDQQRVALSEIKADFRNFVLSTPRIESSDEVYINIPFSSPKLDHLFEAREKAISEEELEEIFHIDSAQRELFRSFFTENSPSLPEDRSYKGEGIRVRYFGHACVLLETKSVSILLDPVISYEVADTKVPRYTLYDLPDHIDFVLLTHNHQDHFMLETLLQLRHKIGTVVFPSNNKGALEDPSIRLMLEHIGFSSLVELDDMQAISVPGGEIIGLPFLGEHADLNIQTKLAYHINLLGKKFIFAADSTNLDSCLYDHIFNWIGEIDFLFLGMECDGAPLSWLYGPLLSSPLKNIHDKERTLSGSDFKKAWPIVEKSKCKNAYVYAMGQEPWLGYIMALQYNEDSPQIVQSNLFIDECRKKGIESERLFGRKEWNL